MRDYLSEYEELISPYALDVLDGDDSTEMENHPMTGCESKCLKRRS